MAQMLPRCSHVPSRLTRKRGVYYYRRRVPGAWREEVALSLRTSVFRKAEYLAGSLDAALTRCSYQMPNRESLKAVLHEYLQTLLEMDWQFRLTAKPGQPVYDAGLLEYSEDPVDNEIASIDVFLGDARERLGRRDFRAVSDVVDTLILQHDLPEDTRNAVALGVLTAQVKSLETARRRALGQDVTLFDAVPVLLETPSGRTPARATKAGQRFSVFASDYCEFSTTEQGWRGQTLQQNRNTFEMFVEWCGDKPVEQYTRRETGAFYEMLRKLPSLYAKDVQWRGKPLKEVIEASEGQDVPRLAMKTIKRHFSALGGLFAHAIRLGRYEGANPAHDFEFPSKGRANAARAMWEGDLLTKLFQSPVWTGCHPHFRSRKGTEIIRDEKFWLPLLGLYQGNRLEEFAQLRREDIVLEDGIWFFDIRGDDGRQLKNEQSKRRVPMHPEIIRVGFLDYVGQFPDEPKASVFPNLVPGGADKKYGHAFTKWWSRYRKDIGVYEPKLDYHSFRHGVTTKLISAGVQQTIVDELTGHEGKGMSAGVYYKGAPLATLHDAIAKVDWPELDFSHLYDEVR